MRNHKYLWHFLCGLFVVPLCLTGVRAGPLSCYVLETTIRQDVKSADVVFWGKITDVRTDPEENESETDFAIVEILKGHGILAGKKTFTVKHKVPNKDKSKLQYLIFCEVYKNRLEAFSGMQITDECKPYIRGVIKHGNMPAENRLAFYFHHLQHKHPDISGDAFREFEKADHKHVTAMARTLKPEQILPYLRNHAKVSKQALPIYAKLLGHCGKKEHAKLLAEMYSMHLKTKHGLGILESSLVSCTLLDKSLGWKLIRKHAQQKVEKEDPSTFIRLYSTLRAIRHLHKHHPQLIGKKETGNVMADLLSHPMVADFVIEDFRKRKEWNRTLQLLQWVNKESHDIPIIRRAMLRFCLVSPHPSAKKFVADWRKRDPEQVEMTLELLKLEDRFAGK